MNRESGTGSDRGSKAGKRIKTLTLDAVQRMWQLLLRHSKGLNSRDRSTAPPQGPDVPERKPLWLRLLALYPWLLLTGFIISFFLDFSGHTLRLLQVSLPLDGLLRILCVSGLIGFTTNWLAITMLFRPSRKRPLLGHGLIPAQKRQIAQRLAGAVARDLINPEIIRKKFKETGTVERYREQMIGHLETVTSSAEFRADLKQWISRYTREVTSDPIIRSTASARVVKELERATTGPSLEMLALRTYAAFRERELREMIEEAILRLPELADRESAQIDDFLDQLPHLLRESRDELDSLVTSLVDHLISRLDVRLMVEESLEALDETRLEKLIWQATDVQLRYIQYLGAVLGTLGGLIIWQPLFSLSLFTLLGGVLLGLDALLARRSGSPT